jgi:Sec-independent protein translocase protein TatA
MLFATLILLGCGKQRHTTKFMMTPIGSMEDSLTTPERLTKELEEELKLEDAKRMKTLQKEAEERKEKKRKPAEKKSEEAKSVESREVK